MSLFIGSYSLYAQKSSLNNPPGKLVDVGGYQLHFNVKGNGPETIVIEPGTGSWSLQWMELQNELSKQFRVVTYDRAGYGWSDTSPYSRSANNIVEELHIGLTKLGINEPFILLGHSYGGLIVKAYVNKYKEDVKAIIFADAATEFQFQKLPPAVAMVLESGKAQFKRTGAMARAGMLSAAQMPIDSALNSQFWEVYQETIAQPSFYDVMFNEMDLLPRTYAYSAIEKPIRQPILVITADNSFGAFSSVPGLPVEDSNTTWFELQKNLLSVSTKSKQEVIPNATHHLLLTAKDEFRKAVINFVKKL